MSDLDYEHISNLFAIVKGNSEHGGKFGSIQDYAMRELLKIDGELKEKRASEKKAEDEKVRAQAEIDAQAKEKEEPEPEPKFDASGKPIEGDTP